MPKVPKVPKQQLPLPEPPPTISPPKKAAKRTFSSFPPPADEVRGPDGGIDPQLIVEAWKSGRYPAGLVAK